MDRSSWKHVGGEVGVLLCHGFTASPLSMRPWGEELARAGYSVSIPLLPGHGATWRETNQSSWAEWFSALEKAYEELAARCTTVVAMGISMGGALTLRLAAQHPEIAAVVVVNPSLQGDWKALQALPLMVRALPALPAFRSDVRRSGALQEGTWLPLVALQSLCELWPVVCSELSHVRQPVLVFRSALDKVVSPTSSRLVLEAVSGPAQEVVLPHSGHMSVLDWDAPHLFAESMRFTEAVLNGEEFSPLPVPVIPEALQERVRLAAARQALETLTKLAASLPLQQVSQQGAALAHRAALAAMQNVRRRLVDVSAQAALYRTPPAPVPVPVRDVAAQL